MDRWTDTLLIPREILGHPVAYTTCATHRHNIHKSHTHRENTFKRSGVVTSTVTEARYQNSSSLFTIGALVCDLLTYVVTSLGYLTKKAQLNIFFFISMSTLETQTRQ